MERKNNDLETQQHQSPSLKNKGEDNTSNNSDCSRQNRFENIKRSNIRGLSTTSPAIVNIRR